MCGYIFYFFIQLWIRVLAKLSLKTVIHFFSIDGYVLGADVVQKSGQQYPNDENKLLTLEYPMFSILLKPKFCKTMILKISLSILKHGQFGDWYLS